MPPLIKALRPPEWIKNLLVFAGVLFSGRLDEADALVDATLTFVAFCAIASAGYLLNDLRDREHDRRHPEKRHRPIASGAVAPETAAITAVAPRDLGRSALGFVGRRRGRRARRPLRRDHDRLLAGAQAAGDHRRDDDRLAVHPPGRRRRGGGRRPRLGVPARLHRLPRPLPRLHQAPPGGHARGETRRGRARGTRPVLEHYSLPFLDQMVAMVTASAIISYVDLRRELAARRLARCWPPRPRSSTGSSATST